MALPTSESSVLPNQSIDTDKAKPFKDETPESYEARHAKQKIILDKVTVEDLKQSAQQAIDAEMKFRKRQKENSPLSDLERKNLTRGAIFEYLARKEYLIDEKTESTPLEQNILDIYREVPQTLHDAVGNLRNPDLIDIRIENDELIITGVAEVKLGLLSAGAFEQIRDFKESLVTLIETLREFKKAKLEIEGFDEAIQASDRLRIKGEAFAQVILVPADRDTTKAWDLLDQNDFKKYGMEDAMEDFALDVYPTLKIRKCAFSRDDIDRLAELIS